MTEINKLELKHIAPYLPYGLRWRFEGEDITHEVVGLDITNTGVKLISPYNDYGSCEINNGRPLFRPMSDLYKEINGEVGIVEIYKKMFIYPQIKDYYIEYDCLKFGKHTFEWLDEFKGFSLDGEAAYILLEVADYLDKNRYDWRYNLLDQNIAINLNEIE